jgi:hypothetical protein
MNTPTNSNAITANEPQFLGPQGSPRASVKTKATAKGASEYQAAAEDGFAGIEHDTRRHGLYTSPLHAAYVVGRWLRETGRAAPRDARASRGDLFKVSDMTLRIHWAHIQFPTITREV